MATIKATGSKQHHTFTLNVWENSTSAVNNTSSCGYSFTMYGGTYAFNWTSKSISWGLTIGDKSFSGSFGKYDANTTLTISNSNSVVITHNDDGTKNINISFWISDGINQSYTTGNCSASGNMTLTAIARKANVTGATDFTDVSNPTIYFTNPGGFKINARLEFQGSYINKENIPNTGSYTFSLTSSEIEALRNACTANTMTVREVIGTCIGSNSETHWSWQDKTFTMTESIATKPSVSINITLNNASLSSAFDGLYIQGKSRLNVTLSAAGKYNADIQSYSAQIDGKVYTSQAFTSNVIETSGNVNITGYAKDSRGFTGSASAQLSFIPYSKPLVVPLTGENAIMCYRSDGNGTRVGNSTSVRIKAKMSFSGVISDGEQKNFCTLQWRRKLSTEVWSDTSHIWENLISEASDTSDYNALLSETVFDVKKSYTVQIRAIDTIGETDIKTFDIPTQDVALHLGKGGKNVSIGTYCDYSEDYTFYSDWKSIFDKGIFANELYVDGSEMIDFIVEQGISGIWTYRKWNSGIAECWGGYYDTVTYTKDSSDTEYVAQGNKISLPEGLFTQVFIPQMSTWTSGWCLAGTYEVNKNTVQAGYRRLFLRQLVEGTTDTIEEYVVVNLKGRWK